MSIENISQVFSLSSRQFIAIEGTQYSLTAQELEAFDAVMVCSRSCDNWQIVEFAGFVRGEDGVSRIAYSEILMDKVTLISGRMIGLGDACKIMNHLSDNGKETSAGLFSYLVGSLYNDIDTAKYLHSSELEACLQDVEKKFAHWEMSNQHTSSAEDRQDYSA